jgi:hypothetical protein
MTLTCMTCFLAPFVLLDYLLTMPKIEEKIRTISLQQFFIQQMSIQQMSIQQMSIQQMSLQQMSIKQMTL